MGSLGNRIRQLFGREPKVTPLPGSIDAQPPRTLKQRLLGTEEKPTIFGRLLKRIGFTIEPAAFVRYNEIDTAITKKRTVEEAEIEANVIAKREEVKKIRAEKFQNEQAKMEADTDGAMLGNLHGRLMQMMRQRRVLRVIQNTWLNVRNV